MFVRVPGVWKSIFHWQSDTRESSVKNAVSGQFELGC
jgi:hypothetical protein